MFAACTNGSAATVADAPASSAALRIVTSISARRSLAAITIVIAGATATWTPAEALHVVCQKAYRACLQGCDKKWHSLDFRRSCYSRCNEDRRHCAWVTDGAPPKAAPTPPEPIRPKGTNNSTPPTGGNKPDPKVPPRADNPRAPMGGGVFQPSTSGSGSSGPIILRTTGAGPSNMNPGGSGAGMRSGKRH